MPSRQSAKRIRATFRASAMPAASEERGLFVNVRPLLTKCMCFYSCSPLPKPYKKEVFCLTIMHHQALCAYYNSFSL